MVRTVPMSAAVVVVLLQLCIVVQSRWGPHPALRELQSAKGWKFVLKKQGVKVWKRTGCDDNANFAVKATMLYPCSAQELAAILTTRDYDVIRKFNPTVVEGADLEWSNNRKERVTWILTKAVFPLQPRDFVCRVRREQIGRAELITNEAATHRSAPAPRRTVRGKLRGVHLVEPAGDGCCLYTCVHEIDPGGAAPRRLVNWFALRKPLQYMRQLRDVAAATAPQAEGGLQAKDALRRAAVWVGAALLLILGSLVGQGTSVGDLPGEVVALCRCVSRAMIATASPK